VTTESDPELHAGVFWDQRYRDEAYAFGTEPNDWFRECLAGLPAGRLLLPGEGEGRNAVHAARHGWRVDAFDPSAHGQRKAGLLARQHGVEIDYRCCLLDAFRLEPGIYDALGIIFLHLPSMQRTPAYRHLAKALKPGGVLIAELYSKDQPALGTGGPPDPDKLYSLDCLETDFPDIDFRVARQCRRDIHEGRLHQGPSSVIQLFGHKT